MTEFNTADLVRAYDAHAEERNEAGLIGRKISHIQDVMATFNSAGVKKILEIGSGPGNAAEVFQQNGFAIECIDVSPKMIELVRNKGITGRVLDCRELSSIGIEYDAVFSVNCLLHIPSVEFPAILKGISGVLAADGLFSLGLWGGDDHEGPYEDDHYEPKRYFVLYSRQTLFRHLAVEFWIEEYQRLTFDDDQFFHKVLLRKR